MLSTNLKSTGNIRSIIKKAKNTESTESTENTEKIEKSKTNKIPLYRI